MRNFGWILFMLGSAMMSYGLIYDPTVASDSLGLERTYNAGMISAKNTYTNTGGFIAVCGAIFAACSPKTINSRPSQEQGNPDALVK